jgi:hypothetical protein
LCKVGAGQIKKEHFEIGDPPTSASATQTTPVYAPAAGPDSDRDGPSRPPQNPLPATHPRALGRFAGTQTPVLDQAETLIFPVLLMALQCMELSLGNRPKWSEKLFDCESRV